MGYKIEASLEGARPFRTVRDWGKKMRDDLVAEIEQAAVFARSPCMKGSKKRGGRGYGRSGDFQRTKLSLNELPQACLKSSSLPLVLYLEFTSSPHRPGWSDSLASATAFAGAGAGARARRAKVGPKFSRS
jgi:hypothetical protein